MRNVAVGGETMGEVKDFIKLYIEDSDLIDDKLSEIEMDLVMNIQDQLYPGHGVITHNLHDSIQSNISRKGMNATIEAWTETEYAGWVNDGHPQQPGRFIPGSWNGNRFIYTPGAKTGMVLKQSFVKGLHFMEKGLDATVAMYR